MKYKVLIIFSKDTDRFSCTTYFEVSSVYPEEEWIIRNEFIAIIHIFKHDDIKVTYNPEG